MSFALAQWCSAYVHDEQLEEGKDVFGGSGRIVDFSFVRVRISYSDRFCRQLGSLIGSFELNIRSRKIVLAILFQEFLL